MKKIRKKVKPPRLNIPSEIDPEYEALYPEGLEPMALAYGPILGQAYQLSGGDNIRPAFYPMLKVFLENLKNYIDTNPEQVGTEATYRLLLGDDEMMIFFKALLNEMKVIWVEIATMKGEVVLDSPGDEDIIEQLKTSVEVH